MRLLVIDDDTDILTLRLQILKNLGHEVIGAKNLREGLFLYMLWHPAEVILSKYFIVDKNFSLLLKIIRNDQEMIPENPHTTRIDQEALAFGSNHKLLSLFIHLGIQNIMIITPDHITQYQEQESAIIPILSNYHSVQAIS